MGLGVMGQLKTPPIIDRKDQMKQISATFPGAKLKSIKDENGIVSLEFETVGVLIFANPSAIGQGLYNSPEGEQPNV